MSRRIDHLIDSGTVVVPYATAGHHPAHSPAASPVVTQVYRDMAPGTVHPFTGTPAVLIILEDGRLMLVAEDRIAHTPGCTQCDPVWAKYDQIIANIPSDAMVSAATEITTSIGPALLLIDAANLDVDDYEDEDEHRLNARPARDGSAI